MSRQGGLSKVGSGVGMTKCDDYGIGLPIGSAAEVAARHNRPPLKLTPKQGATSKGTGVNKGGK